jgi:hypothetical protein
MSSDTLPVIRSARGALAKRVAADGRLVGFDAGRWFTGPRALPVAGFDDLADALDDVSRNPREAVVRGRSRQETAGRPFRRTSDRARHGDAATFEPAPRRWIALDIDGVDEPAGVTFAAEPEAGVEYLRDHLLPEAFEGAACWWQATASAGIKPGIRARLWFWLDRPVADHEAKHWLKGAPVDRALFTPVALHYTAPPLRADGACEPVARRQGRLSGLEPVEVPDLSAAPRHAPVAPVEAAARDLADDEQEELVRAIARAPRAAEIFMGQRDGQYPDRSSRDFAFLLSLAGAGCTSPDLLATALHKLGEIHTLGSKAHRADYFQATVANVIAVAQEGRTHG